MNVFHHGGRIGDLIFALYTMKQLGGGTLILSDYHKPNWDLEIARSLESLLTAQKYIGRIEYASYRYPLHRECIDRVSYDLRAAEDDYNPQAFPEWDGKTWPSNCNIVKRYAVHFGVEYPPQEPWLTVPTTLTPMACNVAVHIPPHRIVRSTEDWCWIYTELEKRGCNPVILTDWYTPLQSAQLIARADMFLGAVSSCNAMAEALGKPTWVEHASGCWNVNSTVDIDGWTNQQVVDAVVEEVG